MIARHWSFVKSSPRIRPAILRLPPFEYDTFSQGGQDSCASIFEVQGGFDVEHLSAQRILVVVLLTARVAVAQYDPPASYYSSAAGLTGVALQEELRSIVSSMTGINYGNARFSAPITDADPNSPGNILLIYNRASVSSAWDTGATWNREHVWPVSRLGVSSPSNTTTSIATDQFNLRPANPSINSSRGNKPFGLDDSTGGFAHQGSYYYPGDADAGDVARAQFYMATRYTQLSLTDAFPSGTQMGDLSSLITYHFADAPDDFERRRNHAIFGLAGENIPAISNQYRQQNRNPFVDHPEYVWSVFVGQENDSQITIDGAIVDSVGGSILDVDLGRVYVGGTIPSGPALMLRKSGDDGTYYAVTTSGEASSSLSGRYNAFRNATADSQSIVVGLDTSTETAGVKSGTVTIDNLDVTTGGGDGHGANDGDDIVILSLAVLDHPVASFGFNFPVAEQFIDFGIVPIGSGQQSYGSSLTNLAANGVPNFVADLDLDSIDGSGDINLLFPDLAPFTGLVQGDVAGFHSFFDPNRVGQFSATYTLNLSDEDLPGEQTQTLTLTLTAEAILAGDYNRNGVVDAADYTFWRDSLGESVDAYAGADGDGTTLVDRGDYLVWKEHFGETAPIGGVGAIAVPEPSVAFLIAIGLISASCYFLRA
jgi:endonuclease I